MSSILNNGIFKGLPFTLAFFVLFYQLSGATYMDIHKAGGGIGFTVKNVHQSSEEELFQSLKQVRKLFLRSLPIFEKNIFVDPWPIGYGIVLSIEGFRVRSLCEAFSGENC